MSAVHHRYAVVQDQRLFYREAGSSGAPSNIMSATDGALSPTAPGVVDRGSHLDREVPSCLSG